MSDQPPGDRAVVLACSVRTLRGCWIETQCCRIAFLPLRLMAVKSLPKVPPFSRANPTPLEVSDRLFEVEDRRAVGLRGVIAEVLGSRSFSPCRTPVVAR